MEAHILYLLLFFIPGCGKAKPGEEKTVAIEFADKLVHIENPKIYLSGWNVNEVDIPIK